MIKPQTLKGFRDFLPKDAIRRQSVIGTMKDVFEQFGFDPLETPALEYAETLQGKYGDEADKLLYLFEDNGKRKVGLRYDQTVPLSRVVAQYPNLPKPFKRYQIQPVWRAENTQKGRYREFLQCDIDTVGTDSYLADVEIISCVIQTLKRLGFKKPQIWINDRTIFDALKIKKREIMILDKLEKIGKDAVIAELTASGTKNAEELFATIQKTEKTPRLEQIFAALTNQGCIEGEDFLFVRFLARGLDYYTSTIFEAKILDTPYVLSVAGGGRYDKLIGSFMGSDVPAVGVAFGFDRMLEAMEELMLLPQTSTATQILVCIVSGNETSRALTLTAALRNKGIRAELYTDEQAKLDKQLKYADRKGIPYVAIAGPDEAGRGVIKLKDMKAKQQEELTIDALIEKFRTN